MKPAIIVRACFVLLTLVAIALHACSLQSAAAPAPRDRGSVPDAAVWDEGDHKISLRSKLKGLGPDPVILLPLYTRCTGSCPVLTRKLQSELARLNSKASYHVVLFSFDPAETSESLKLFRERERLPGEWLMVRGDELEIRRFFDFFHYSVMKENGALIHPSEIFLLTIDASAGNELRWRASLVGVDWSARDLEKELKEIQSPSLMGRIEMNPETIAKTALAGLIASLGFLIAWITFRKASRPIPQH